MAVTQPVSCHNPGQLFALSFYMIISCIQIVLCGIAFYRMFVKKSLIKSKISKLLKVSQFIFYASSFLFAVTRIIVELVNCIGAFPPLGLLPLIYCVHLCAFNAMLYARLRDVYTGTQFALHSFTKCGLSIALSLLIITAMVLFIATAAITILYVHYGASYNVVQLVSLWSLITALLFLLWLILSQLLVWMFVYKLSKLSKIASKNQYHSGFVKVIRKYAILNMICVMFTTLYIVLALLAIAYKWRWITIAPIYALDVFTDTVCQLIAFNLKITQNEKRVDPRSDAAGTNTQNNAVSVGRSSGTSTAISSTMSTATSIPVLQPDVSSMEIMNGAP